MSNAPKINALSCAPWLFSMARVFERAQTPLYAVGGVVRNPLMNLLPSDVDVCGPALPSEVQALCQNSPVRAVVRAARFGTVELYVTDEHGAEQMAEYTTFRTDRYDGGHRPTSVRFETDLAVDALRRDFSVNALYRRLYADGAGEVIDPTGGLAHLRQGVLHTVTQDPDRVLSNDGQRILRAARFQAELGLAPTDALMQSLARHAGLVSELAREQIRAEVGKLLLADLRYPTLMRTVPATASGLQTLHAVGAWRYVLGDVPYDDEAAIALSRFQVPDGLSPLAARTALLIHSASAEQCEATLTELRFTTSDTAAALLLSGALRDLRSGTLTLARGASMGRQAVHFAAAAAEALHDGAALACAQELEARLSSVPTSLAELRITGRDLQPLLKAAGAPPAQMGLLLGALLQAAIAGEVANEPPALLSAAQAWLQAHSPAEDAPTPPH